MRLVVADTGPLTVIAKTIGIEMLCGVCEEIRVPSVVVSECIARLHKPAASSIKKALDAGMLIEDPSPVVFRTARELRNAGEKAAIELAKILGCPLLIDDKRGRKRARTEGVSVIGSLRILLLAKRAGLIDEVRPVFDLWRDGGYFVDDDLYRQILLAAGEPIAPQP